MKKIYFNDENIKLIGLKNEIINSFNIKTNNKNNIYFHLFRNKKNNIKIYILILLIYVINLLYIDYLYLINNKNGNNSELYINHNNETFLKPQFVKKFNSFINLCKNRNFDNTNKYPLIKNPFISVIIPIYNGGKYLFYSLRSIQNQRMKKIEIILIDDNSRDNSLKIIKKFMKEDQRIRLIKNYKNRKILYSKSIGALNSKGKYIIELDQDDMFIRDDCFDILYNEAEKNNLDLVQIRDISKKDFKLHYNTIVNSNINDHLIYPQKSNYKDQPLLKKKIYIENNIFLLWGLLIKSDLYKKAIYHLWPIIINYQLTFHEDYSISFLIILLSKRYKYLNQFALLHFIHSKSTSNKYKDNKRYYLSVLFVSNIIYYYYIKNNPEDINILINYINLFIDCFRYGKKNIPDLFKNIINKIYNNEYIPLYKKIDIINQIDYNNSLNINSFSDINDLSKNLKNYIYQDIFQNKTYMDYYNNTFYHITIIIYCTEYKFLTKTINSILEQIYINVEIIIIYDNIEQKDLFYIKNFIRNYKFIKLIYNKTIKGIIYSISISVLKSIGQYILYLQSGYILFKENSLNDIYIKSFNSNLDILEFNIFINNNFYLNSQSLSLYKCQHIKSNLNLNLLKYNKLYKEIDQEKELLFNKLIKADLFKNIINEYKFLKYQKCIFNYYDNIIIFALINKKIKFEHIDYPGVIKNIKDINELHLSHIMSDKNQKRIDSIFYINYLFENSNNTYKTKKYVLNEFINIFSIIFNKNNKIFHDSLELFKKFNKSKLININDKNELNIYYNSFIN